ncbi:hypothetical protein [Streptomyces sp. NPDC004284]|uniref:hypothetical protein n=1 Tax=Streptomyces sp. NPDC004284 TaxID=3364695 RepID=UPI00367C77F6
MRNTVNTTVIEDIDGLVPELDEEQPGLVGGGEFSRNRSGLVVHVDPDTSEETGRGTDAGF